MLQANTRASSSEQQTTETSDEPNHFPTPLPELLNPKLAHKVKL